MDMEPIILESSTDNAKPPALVLALAEKLHLTPIAWNVHPGSVVIVFKQGPKITFDRAQMDGVTSTVKVKKNEDPELTPIIQNPRAEIIAPQVQKLPVRRARKPS